MKTRLLLMVQQLPQQPQVQYSLTDQLEVLARAATRLGLYDAADFVQREIDTVQQRQKG